MGPRFSCHGDRHDLDRALAAEIVACLATAIDARGAATLVVSGGRTPVGSFEALSWHGIDWSRVTITLADERWIGADHDDSNERLVRAHLLRNQAASAHFVPLKNAATTPEEGVAACNAALTRLRRPFDVVVLGMGDDGHTASLFPDATEISAALESQSLCVAVRPTRAPHGRMSLTPRALLDSRAIKVQIDGAGKRRVIELAMSDGPVAELPIRVALAQRAVPVDVLWCP